MMKVIPFWTIVTEDMISINVNVKFIILEPSVLLEIYIKALALHGGNEMLKLGSVTRLVSETVAIAVHPESP
jgi:hypothetical protein